MINSKLYKINVYPLSVLKVVFCNAELPAHSAGSGPLQKRPEIDKNDRKTDLFGGETKMKFPKIWDLQWPFKPKNQSKPVIFN